jgi:hypothetical protein
MGYLQDIFTQDLMRRKTVKVHTVVVWVRVLACRLIHECEPDCDVVPRRRTFHCTRSRGNRSSQLQKFFSLWETLCKILKEMFVANNFLFQLLNIEWILGVIGNNYFILCQHKTTFRKRGCCQWHVPSSGPLFNSTLINISTLIYTTAYKKNVKKWADLIFLC